MAVGDGTSWHKPWPATLTAIAGAGAIVLVVSIAFANLKVGANNTADPNTATIAAIVSSAFTAIAATISAYFGIKAATEQAGQAQATAQQALTTAEATLVTARELGGLAPMTPPAVP